MTVSLPSVVYSGQQCGLRGNDSKCQPDSRFRGSATYRDDTICRREVPARKETRVAMGDGNLADFGGGRVRIAAVVEPGNGYCIALATWNLKRQEGVS